MLLRRFTDFILKSRLQAMATAFLFAYIPLIGSVSVLIAALVTLRKGAFEGALVICAAILPFLLSYAIQPSTEVWIIGVLLASNLLTWLFAVSIRRYSNWSLTLDFALVLGVAAVIAIHLMYPDLQAWWASQLTAYLDKSTGVLNQVQPQMQEIPPEAYAQMITVAKLYATGFLVVSILFNALLQVVLARWWQAVMFNPGGLRKELHKIRLSYVTGFVFVAAMALSYINNATALDALPVIYGVYCAAGLSLLHALLNKTRFGWLLLVLIYLVAIWLFPLSAIIIAIIALLDVSIDFRKRLHKFDS